MNAPFFSLVPMDPAANVEWRAELVRWVGEDPKRASEVAGMCRLDRLFYVNTFAWTYDPRNKRMPVRPFVMFPKQVEEFPKICDAIEVGGDTITAKSRDMGASWLHLLAYAGSWHFDENMAYQLASRNEGLVDDSENPDSLFWKLDFLLANFPKWLRPNYTRRKLHLFNKDTGSEIGRASCRERV